MFTAYTANRCSRPHPALPLTCQRKRAHAGRHMHCLNDDATPTKLTRWEEPTPLLDLLEPKAATNAQ